MGERSYLPELVVCGYEKGGTTLFSEILRHNGWASGFECGALMCATPADFPDFQPYFELTSWHWGVTEAQVRSFVGGDFAHFYASLFRAAFSHMPEGTRFFDKSPIYMRALGAALHRTPFLSRAIVISRDPRSVFVSWASRQVQGDQIEKYIVDNLEHYAQRYLDYFIGAAPYLDHDDVVFVSFAGLVESREEEIERINVFLNQKLIMQRENLSRFRPVRGLNMQVSEITKYKNYLSERVQEVILEKCSLAAQFFLTASERIAFADKWLLTMASIDKVLRQHQRAQAGQALNGVWFEPVGYLLRNPDVLAASVDPLGHYLQYGIKEGRQPL